jgi:ABC-type bacteriocin/lantibiotic exporter with double-glycine peptidase domain
MSLISSIFFIIIFIATKKKLSSLEEENNERNKDISNFVIEKTNLIFEVKKNNKEEVERENFNNNELKNINGIFNRKNIFNYKLNIMRNTLYISTISISLFLSIYLYEKGSVTIGEIASINMYVTYLN